MRIGPARIRVASPEQYRGGVATRSWSFLRRPFWVFSHVFAGSMIVFCLWAMVWQLGRLDERRETNAVVAERLDDMPLDNAAFLAATAASPGDQLEFTPVELTGVFVESELVRVVNRSAGGLPVEWVVVRFLLDEGDAVVVNTGYLAADEEAPVLTDDTVTLRGWIRPDEEKSLFGVNDDGESFRLPRLSAAAVDARTDDGLPLVDEVWIQRADVDGAVTGPTPVPLPSTDEGPHRSYAVQWATFAALTALFYGAILRRRAREEARTAAAEVADGSAVDEAKTDL